MTTQPVDKKAFPAIVAERAGLSKEEARDLARATLEELAGQLSPGELRKLVPTLPDWLQSEIPRHERPAQPVEAGEFVRRLARRTGLKEDEVRKGVRAVLTTLREAMDPQHLDLALAQLPREYRELATAESAPPGRQRHEPLPLRIDGAPYTAPSWLRSDRPGR